MDEMEIIKAAFEEELQKIASVRKLANALAEAAHVVPEAKGLLSKGVGKAQKFFENYGGLNETAGLGVLAAPSIDELQAHHRAVHEGDTSDENVHKKRLIGDLAGAGAEIGGLGMLTAPYITSRLAKGHWAAH